MGFSDDQLRMLKEDGPEWEMPSYEILAALLARLEAAERVVRAVTLVHDLNFKEDWRKGNKEIVEAYEAWRKSAGKDGVR